MKWCRDCGGTTDEQWKWYIHFGKKMVIPKRKSNIHVLYECGIQIVGIYSKEIKAYVLISFAD